jgi:hypothetical protein
MTVDNETVEVVVFYFKTLSYNYKLDLVAEGQMG